MADARIITERATDDFNRTNNTTSLGANWTDFTAVGSGNVGVISNQAYSSDGSNDQFNYYSGVSFNVNQYAQATVKATHDDYSALVIRMTASDYVNFEQTGGGGSGRKLIWYNSASYTQIGSTYAGDFALNDVVRIEAYGSSFYGYINGALVISGSNSSAPSTGNPGLKLADTTFRWDDFSAGDIISPYPYKVKPRFASVDTKHPLARGLVADYLFDEGGGTVAYNKATTNRRKSATFTGNASWATSEFGRVVTNDGSATGGIVQAEAATSQQDNWTLEARFWINALPTTGGSYPDTFDMIIYNGDDGTGGTGGYGFGVGGNDGTNGSKLIILFGGVAWKNTSYTFEQSGRWYHGVLRRKNGTMEAFIDGMNIGYTDTQTPNSPANRFAIACQDRRTDGIKSTFNGKVAYGRCWKRALSDKEILSLYLRPFQFYKKKQGIRAGIIAAFNNYTQTLTETVSLTDSIIRTNARNLTETVTITASLIKTASRTLLETITNSDTLFKIGGKVLSETVTHTDSILKTGGKLLSETVSLTDTLIRSVVRTLTETVTHSDTVLKTTGRTFSETVTHSDVLTALKAAVKELTETVSLSDTFIRSATRTLSETVSLSDTLLRAVVRTLIETVTHTDTLIKSPSRTLTETITHTDTLIRTIVRTLTETTSLTATLQKIAGRTLSETITLSDSLLKNAGKLLSETINYSDTLFRTATRNLLETVNLTDTLITFKSLIREFTEAIDLSAVLVTNRGVVFSETITLVDTFLRRIRWYRKLNTVLSSLKRTVWQTKQTITTQLKKRTRWYTKKNTNWED